MTAPDPAHPSAPRPRARGASAAGAPAAPEAAADDDAGASRAADGAASPVDVATRAFDAGLVVDAATRAALAELDLAGGPARLRVAHVTTWLDRLPLTAEALGDGCAERRVRGARDAGDAARDAERARAVREAAALKRELERLDG